MRKLENSFLIALNRVQNLQDKELSVEKVVSVMMSVMKDFPIAPFVFVKGLTRKGSSSYMQIWMRCKFWKSGANFQVSSGIDDAKKQVKNGVRVILDIFETFFPKEYYYDEEKGKEGN